MSNIIIRAAVESDSEAILNFLRNSYYPEEPLTIALEPFQQAEEDEQFNMSCIKYGTCVIAYNEIESKNSSSCSDSLNSESLSSNAIVNNSSTIGIHANDSEINFPNHEARNQHDNKEEEEEENNDKNKPDISIKNSECNSNQCNQNYHYDHQQQQQQKQHQNNTNEIQNLNINKTNTHDQTRETMLPDYNKLCENPIQTVPELVGVLIAGPKYPDEVQHLIDESNSVKSPKWSKMLKFLANLESKSNVFKHFNCDSAVHCHAMAVHQNARGKSIGIKLLEKFIEICKCLQYPVITLDCTSIYSIRLCEKLNMICLNETSFTDYRNENGDQVFRPPAPHNLVKTFAKKIQ